MVAPWNFYLKKVLGSLLFPPLFPFFLIFCGLIQLHRRRRGGLLLIWMGLLIGIIFSTPGPVEWMAKGLEAYPIAGPKQIAEAQAIIILGGGHRGLAKEFYTEAPSRDTLERLRYGAYLARQSSLPLLVTGYGPEGEQQGEAATMAETLRSDYGLTVRWIEDRSLDTVDNARYSVSILKKAGVSRVLLVTTALHMRRSVLDFRRAGLSVIPAPTAFVSDRPKKRDFLSYLPSMSSAYVGAQVAHEWGGIVFEKLKEAIGR